MVGKGSARDSLDSLCLAALPLLSISWRLMRTYRTRIHPQSHSRLRLLPLLQPHHRPRRSHTHSSTFRTSPAIPILIVHPPILQILSTKTTRKIRIGISPTIGSSVRAVHRGGTERRGIGVSVVEVSFHVWKAWKVVHTINTISGVSMASSRTAGLLAYLLSIYPSATFGPSLSSLVPSLLNTVCPGSPFARAY